jgi:hypothetical protein
MKLRILLLAMTLYVTTAYSQRNCPAHTLLHQHENADPEIKKNREEIEKFTQNFVKNNPDGERATFNIPVVVHVLYNTATQNISDAQILSQITVLNNDYQLLNADNTSVPAAFSALKANVSVSFCLAKQDLNGVTSTGIIRKQVTKTVFDAGTDDAKKTSTGGDDIWDRNQYLNIWIVPSIKSGSNTGILGYAQFPGGTAATDGVVIAHQYFGTTGTAAAPFNKGRTATHEVGHWLNLNHIWGDDGTACTGTDNVADTPNQAGENYGCPTFPKVSCTNGPNGDMFMNYMDYTDDACMFMFSTGQKTRMQAVLTTGGARASLNSSIRCNPGTVATTCTAPTGLASSAITTTGATVSWAAVTGATSYTLQYKTAAATTFTTVTGITTTSRALTGLTAGTTYNFQVLSVCSATSSSAYSASTFVTTAATSTCSDLYESNNTIATATAATVGTTYTAGITTSTDLDYFKFSNTTTTKNIKITLNMVGKDYDIRLYNSAGTQVKFQTTASNPEILVYNTTVVGQYYFRIEGYTSAFSASTCYTVKAELSATALRGQEGFGENNLTENEVNVYPNPTNGLLNIQLPEEKFNREMQVTLVNSIGQRVFASKFGENAISTIDMNNFNNGMYFLQIRDENNNIVNKRVVLEK